jgi:hypothetical protein
MSLNEEFLLQTLPGAGLQIEADGALSRNEKAKVLEIAKVKRRPSSRLAAELGISRQRLYQMRQREAGLCLLCPEVAISKSSLCIVHFLSKREMARRRCESKPQYQSGRGRKPIVPDRH